MVTTMGKLKEQYDEPDWAPTPTKIQETMHQPRLISSPRGQMESRDQYWAYNNTRGGNSLLPDERDCRVPANSFSHQFPQTIGGPLSPKRYQQMQPQQLSNRDVASYKAAIKAVDDSMTADGRGSVTALRGIWKVFDAGISELGTELNDSLSNKAIFEGEGFKRVIFFRRSFSSHSLFL